MNVDGMLKLCWLIANEEAKHLGEAEIAPLHFMLGVMKIVDPEFPNQLDKTGVSSDEWAEMCKAAQSIRHYIDIKPDCIARKRRKLRARLAEEQRRQPTTQGGMLHRSASLKRAFHDACLFKEGGILRLRSLVQSLFELELVSLDDIKG